MWEEESLQLDIIHLSCKVTSVIIEEKIMYMNHLTNKSITQIILVYMAVILVSNSLFGLYLERTDAI